MLRLIAATLVAMYLVAITAGERPEGEVVARAADPAFELSLTAFVGMAEASASDDLPEFGDAEAVEIALAAGAEMRRNRGGATPLLGTRQIAAAVAPSAVEAPRTDLWQVTGSVVNLRAGPGTGNEVVAKLTAGTEAEVVDEGEGWYRIRTADGAVDGWIFGKYLSKAG